MDVCGRCGKLGHATGACPSPQGSMPPPGSSIPPFGSVPPPEYATSGAYATSQNPIHRSLRLLKTQLNLAIGQREEDPERAWLEALSVRDRVEALASGAQQDPILVQDIDRFRGKLLDALKKLTRDVGDDVVAPLYSWVDLLRQREQLDAEVQTASTRVAEARASRGAPVLEAPRAADAAAAALEAREKELATWRQEMPPAPPVAAIAVWDESGGETLRPRMPTDAAAVRERGLRARELVGSFPPGPLGVSLYAGSRVELAVLPSLGAAALLSSMFAFSLEGPHLLLSLLAVLACASFAAGAMASWQARRRASSEAFAALNLVWHHLFATEQIATLELEVGWLRALAAALRARAAFDEHKGEGGQLAELSKWRPDLVEVVVEVARSSLAPPTF